MKPLTMSECMRSVLILLLNFILAFACTFLLILALSSPSPSEIKSMLELYAILGAVLGYLLIFYPSASYLSMKKHFSKLRYSFLYSPLISLSLVLGFSAFGVRRRSQLVYVLGLFLWCELWALIGMIKIKRNKQSEPEENDDGYI